MISVVAPVSDRLVDLSARFAATCAGGGSFFDFPTWYKYLQNGTAATGEKCAIGVPSLTPDTFLQQFPLIGLALLEMLLRVAGIAAIAFVVWGSIQYVTSQGEPDQVGRAKGTIVNALVGLVIATLAVAIVQFVGNKVG